jgi:hypothetical protein
VSRTVIVFIVFGVLAVIGIIGMLIQRARAAAALRRERRTPVPLVIPVTRGVQPPTPWRPPATPANGAVVQPVGAYAEGSNGSRAAGANGSSAPYAPLPASFAHMETPEAPVRRQPQPAALEGTLQLRPGRFEVVAGMDGGRDIRFVRGPGGTPEVTLGRMEGPTYRHVQLPAQTVSRMHARMRFEAGRWHISNLSPTNPVVINGEPLEADGQSRTLNEGDRVELGEVVLRFRERA